MTDPIVEEIRGFRDEHAKSFNYDLDAIYKDLRFHQAHFKHKLVRLKAKKIAKQNDTTNTNKSIAN